MKHFKNFHFSKNSKAIKIDDKSVKTKFLSKLNEDTKAKKQKSEHERMPTKFFPSL